ncbi:MAG: diguanylate cyclase [Gammaproteobacteria bacterium]|nr:diguanylate cyclase [Gammaproteobacteria bacterium]
MSFLVATSVFVGFTAVCYFLLGVRMIGGQRDVGSIPLGAAFLVIAVWVFGGAVEMMATSETVFTVGRVGHYVGTALVPVLILLCFREITGRSTSRRTLIALLILPIISIVVAATNTWHEFMWHLPATNAAGEFLTRPVEFGPWFRFAHMPYGYAVVVTSILTLVLHSSAVAPAQRRGLLLLAGSATVPIIATVAYDLGIGPSTISTLPLIFALMLPIYAWLILAEKIIEYTPLAYETVFQNMQDPVIVVDDQERIIGINHGAESMLNMSESDALRASLDQVFGDEAMEVHVAIDTGEPQKMMTNSGRFLHVQVTPIATNQARAKNANVVMFRDVSDVEKAQREVKNSEKLLRTLIDHSVNGVIRLRWMVDDEPGATKELRCSFANAAAGRYLDSDPNAMIDCTAEDILRLGMTGMAVEEAKSLRKRFIEAAENGEAMDAEAPVAARGETKWLRIISEPVGEDVAMTFIDVSDTKAKEEKMESIARSDPLTGVLNRRGFERDAARRLTESADDATGALLFIDLNDFKKVNDLHGHQVGDQLLKISAERLQKSLRSHDIIGRPGGDEFVALVPDVRPDVAEKLAARLTRTLEQAYRINGEDLHCAASIGFALYPEHANTLTGLMRAADAAMYRAKARCRGVENISGTDLLEKAG